MACITYLYKVIENDNEVIYKFGGLNDDEGDSMGLLRFNRKTEELSELRRYNGLYKDRADLFYRQACFCFVKLYKSGKYPSFSCREI